jgi:GNAT superfamily N-acetyltransferase
LPPEFSTAGLDRSYAMVVERRPDPIDLAMLEERLAEAAVVAIGSAEEDVAVFVRDAGQIVAGVSGSIWSGCCQVHTLWIDESLRGRGLARALMAEVEAEAQRRGCRLVMGLTYDALTGDFYDQIGYTTVGVIEDCPAGTATRWYCKCL